jgi:hypothetical protein
MQRKILKSFISLLVVIFSCIPMYAQQHYSYSRQRMANRKVIAQKKDKNKDKDNKTTKIITPLYNGLYVGVDLYGPGASLLGSDFFSTEVQASVNLKNRYMPALEIGYGKTDTWNENGIHYKNSAPYIRIGADYNFRWKKVDYDDVLYMGLRYGFTSFKYDVAMAAIPIPFMVEKLATKL